MKHALFLNGVFETVLHEILKSQERDPELICFLQPYSSSRIVLLEKESPSVESPIPLYISTTTHLGTVGYKAIIVGWENKQKMSRDRLAVVNAAIKKYQPKEECVYMHVSDERPCVNLISVKHLTPLPNPVSVVNLVKRDGSPVKPRTRAGNWAYVNILPDWVGVSATVIKEQLDREFDDTVKKSLQDNNEDRRERLAKSPSLPAKVQVVSHAYRRNPDVVAEVLIRANGKCESCKRDAPFLRASNRTPYLEIHHIVMFSNGGEDTVANATALCPNCHRKMHFGILKKES